MSSEQKKPPFKSLGEKLKTIRQKLHESVAEVSGAVEIDEKVLQRIECGDERPSEDILMLLISHFGMQDDEAAGLWQLAGYDQPKSGSDTSDEQPNNGRTMVMIMAVDPRIMFSDGVQVVANTNGVTMTFSQATGTPQALTTARIGMSREQAYNVLQVLSRELASSETRQLPSSTAKNKQDSSQKTDKSE